MHLQRLCIGLVICTAVSSYAGIKLVLPEKARTVAIVPEVQRKLMDVPTHAERLGILMEDRKSNGPIARNIEWKSSRPLILKWMTTGWEKAPWTVKIGKQTDLSDARVWHLDKTYPVTTNGVVEFVVPMANLEIGTQYYWQVSCRRKCKKFGLFCIMGHGHRNGKRRTSQLSAA